MFKKLFLLIALLCLFWSSTAQAAVVKVCHPWKAAYQVEPIKLDGNVYQLENEKPGKKLLSFPSYISAVITLDPFRDKYEGIYLIHYLDLTELYKKVASKLKLSYFGAKINVMLLEYLSGPS